MASENEFAGKVALVTGATSGMGWAAAVEFASAGTNVVATGRRIEQGAALEAESANLPGKIKFVQADVTVLDDIKQMVDTAVNSFGRLDFAFTDGHMDSMAQCEKL